MIGRRVSHYEIVRRAGHGGMGVVYEAKDLKLPRSVALKFLPGHISGDAKAKKRFVNEARAVSALDHPNISAIHDIDEDSQAGLFIVMPFYRGKTLDALIEDGPLGVEHALDLIGQIGNGLAKVHTKGIVHLDIKPSNIFVTEDGLAKILDFGIARSSDSTKVTADRATLGTVAYMSPEQASGGDVDHRSDIWSTAVVLYEMLASTVPFRASTEMATIAAILTREPEDLMRARPDTPPAVARAVETALRKDPQQRYQDMPAFLAGLEPAGPAAVARAPAVRVEDLSIVVCPFEDLSPGGDNAYFSDGLTEEIITDLSQVRRLRVISKSSSALLKGTTKDTKTISRELGVRYLLRGSVRKSGNNLRISAQCVDARRNVNVWADKYSGTLDNVFDIQESVSRAIVNALELELSPHESVRVSRRSIGDVYAYECYLRARHELYLWSEEALDRAVGYLEEGLGPARDNALLLAGLAHAHWQYVNAGFRPPSHLRVAQDFVDQVLALEPDSSHGHRIKGLIAMRSDLQKAAHHFVRALATNPNDPDSLFWLITVYLFSGRMDEAEPLATSLLEIDPLNPLARAAPGWLAFFGGRFDRALDVIRSVYDTDPTNPVYRFFLVQLLAYNDRAGEASRLAGQLEEDLPGHPLAAMAGMLGSALSGDGAALESRLTPELRAVLGADAQYCWFVATCDALVGNAESAVGWLGRAADLGFVNHPFLAEHDHLLDGVRSAPAFTELLGRIRNAWEAFEA